MDDREIRRILDQAAPAPMGAPDLSAILRRGRRARAVRRGTQALMTVVAGVSLAGLLPGIGSFSDAPAGRPRLEPGAAVTDGRIEGEYEVARGEAKGVSWTMHAVVTSPQARGRVRRAGSWRVRPATRATRRARRHWRGHLRRPLVAQARCPLQLRSLPREGPCLRISIPAPPSPPTGGRARPARGGQVRQERRAPRGRVTK
jgi:hypothetical protein